jgi:hypothetical protein
VPKFILDHLRNPFAFGYKLIYACAANFHQAKLCCDEETIGSYQHEYRQNSYEWACIQLECPFQKLWQEYSFSTPAHLS